MDSAAFDPVIDISHHNGAGLRFDLAASAGVLGVIHKATQGLSDVDPMYAANRAAASDAGLLFGAYHFGDGSDPVAQAKHFLGAAGLRAGDLMALDYEPNPAGSSMTVGAARTFVAAIHDATGRWPVLYSGSTLKEALGSHADPVLSECPLWLAEYGPQAVLPAGWPSWSLWQYTDGAIGSPPAVPGIGHCDRSRFSGPGALQDLWARASLSSN